MAILFWYNVNKVEYRERYIQGGFQVESKVELLSSVKLTYTSDLYKIVDSLNKTLKKENLMFGLALDKQDQQTAVFSIYRT